MRVAPACLASALVLALAGCAQPYTQQPYDATAGFGDAVSQNASVMIINPEPPTALDTELDMEGHRAWIAITRYQTGTTIAPRAQSTTSGVGMQ